MAKEELIMFTVTGAFCFLVLWVGISRWRSRSCCKEKHQAEFVRLDLIRSGNAHNMKGLFEITHRKRKESCYAVDDLGGKKGKQFAPGEMYTIYVNPKNPLQFRCTNKVFSWNDLFLILFGGVGFLGMLGLLISEIGTMLFG